MFENLTKGIKDTFKKDDSLTAEKAWVETTYGTGSYRPIEKRIVDKQKQISNTIKGKYGCGANEVATLRSYRCVVDIEEDLKNNIEEILAPFREGGFDIINLSERIPEIYDENVYLISWRHIFDRQGQPKHNCERPSRPNDTLFDKAKKTEQMICS